MVPFISHTLLTQQPTQASRCLVQIKPVFEKQVFNILQLYSTSLRFLLIENSNQQLKGGLHQE